MFSIIGMGKRLNKGRLDQISGFHGNRKSPKLGRVRFGASGFHGPFICFFEMRFDLGTLDSGERSLPFGLLVFILCGFVVYTTCALCFNVFPCSLFSCFVILLSMMVTLLGEEGTVVCASRAFVCLLCTC